MTRILTMCRHGEVSRFQVRKNAVVGIKPTPGLVSQQGIFVLNQYQDAAGPIARTVKDAARILQVIAGTMSIVFLEFRGFHWWDTNTRARSRTRWKRAEHWRRLCRCGYSKPARWHKNCCKFPKITSLAFSDEIHAQSPSHIITQDREVVSRYEKSLEELRDLGATVLKDVRFPEWTTDTRDDHADLLDLSFRVLARTSKVSWISSLPILADQGRYEQISCESVP